MRHSGRRAPNPLCSCFSRYGHGGKQNWKPYSAGTKTYGLYIALFSLVSAASFTIINVIKHVFLWTFLKTLERLNLLRCVPGLESFHLLAPSGHQGLHMLAPSPLLEVPGTPPGSSSSSLVCYPDSQLIVFNEPGWVTLCTYNHKET